MTKKEYNHRYYINNKKKILAHCKEYSQKNKYWLRPNRLASMKKFSQTPKGIYKTLKDNAKSRRLPVLSQLDFIIWYNQTPKFCYYCDIPPEKLSAEFVNICGRRTTRLTIDRLNSTLGYVENNMVLSCYRCNIIKSNFFTPPEMKELAQLFVKPKWLV